MYYVNFLGHDIECENGLFKITTFIKKYNKETGKKKQLGNFFKSQSINRFIDHLINIKGKENVIVTIKGRDNGGTWLCSELMPLFENWLHQLPMQKPDRKENIFFDNIKKAFKGIFTIERQYMIGPYSIDGYITELNLCIEFNEKHHQKQIEKDIKRIQSIKNQKDGEFLIHQEEEDIFSSINFIIKKLKEANEIKI